MDGGSKTNTDRGETCHSKPCIKEFKDMDIVLMTTPKASPPVRSQQKGVDMRLLDRINTSLALPQKVCVSYFFLPTTLTFVEITWSILSHMSGKKSYLIQGTQKQQDILTVIESFINCGWLNNHSKLYYILCYTNAILWCSYYVLLEQHLPSLHTLS